MSKNVNSRVSHSASQFHKTSTPKSSKVYLTLTESSVSDCYQSPIRQLHFDSPGPEPPLSVDGHSPTNTLGKNNGTEAQVATVSLQQAYTNGDPDLSNDLVLGTLPSEVPNHDPQADSSLCEYPGPSNSSSEQGIVEYSESEQALSSCTSQELFYSLEQCSLGCKNSTSMSEDYLGSQCHGQSIMCDHSADDHLGLLSHGWSPSQSGLSGSMGHNKPTQYYV